MNKIFSIYLIVIVLTASLGLSCSQNTCQPIPGLGSMLKAGQLILLGEMHGTKEAPHFVKEISCNAIQKELPVTVFLELPQADQQQLDLFLSSEGSKADIQNFLSLNFWSRNYQDGRASQAMFELINSIRVLKQSGNAVNIVFIDIQSSGNRDLTMAQRILEEMKIKPDNFFVALTGNMHSRISNGSGGMGSYVIEKIGTESVTSLVQTYSGGSAWVCLMEGCGAFDLGGNGKREIGVFLSSEMNDYNGTLAMDSIHASLPAKDVISFK